VSRLSALAALLLSACAYAPISETPVPAADLARCETVAEQHSLLPRAAVRAGEGAVAGAIGDQIVKRTVIAGTTQAFGASLKTSSVLSVPSLILPFVVIAAIEGVIEATDRRAAITRECLRDLGHRVY
jgi:hypothetical protein